MEFIHLMTNLSEHPKWLATSDRGRSVLIALWCYCGRNETDGHIPLPAARREGLTGPLADQLERIGWVTPNGDGWYVHDWGDYQVAAGQLREDRERERALARERKHAQRVRDRDRKRGSNGA